MPERSSFEYAIIRVVPNVERDECVNVGIILFCKLLDFLAVKLHSDLRRVRALASDCDIAEIESQLNSIAMLCSDKPLPPPFQDWSKSERFSWLVAKSSTMIQASPSHGGVTGDPGKTLDELYDLLVA